MLWLRHACDNGMAHSRIECGDIDISQREDRLQYSFAVIGNFSNCLKLIFIDPFFKHAPAIYFYNSASCNNQQCAYPLRYECEYEKKVKKQNGKKNKNPLHSKHTQWKNKEAENKKRNGKGCYGNDGNN